MTFGRLRTNGNALFFASALTLLQSLPWLWFLIPGISLISLASESIGYRYFHSLRLLEEEQSTIWSAQGQSLGVLHQGFHGLLNFAGFTDLQTRIDLFSYGTLAVNSLIFALIAFRFATCQRVDSVARLLVSGAALFGVYGSWWAHTASRLPDYYTWEVTLTYASVALFVSRTGRPATNWRATAALGMLGGIMTGVKFTLLPTAILPFLPTLLYPGRKLREHGFHIAVWAGSAGVTVLLILLVYYRFDLEHLGRALIAWRSYVAAPGAEPNFVRSILNPFAVGNNPWAEHRFVPVALGLWLLGLLGSGCRRQPGGPALLAVVMIFSALHILAVVIRPAETTLFESTLFLVATGAGLLAVRPDGAVRTRLTAGWLVILVSWCFWSGWRHLPGPAQMADFRMTSRHAWELHEWLNRQERPIIIHLPDNRYTSGTVEEALLKGFSDVPTWNITTGYTLMDRIAPRRQFATNLSAVPHDSVLVWTDGPALAAPFKPDPSLPRERRSWSMRRNAYWFRTVHADVFSAVAPTESTIVSTRDWKDATRGDPLPGFSAGPRDADPIVELRVENGQRVVRVTASKAASYLAVGATIPPQPTGTALRLQATARASRLGTLLWQLHDVIDESGAAERVAETVSGRAGIWVTWAARLPALRPPAGSDNFSICLIEPKPGDWLEVRSIELTTEDPAGISPQRGRPHIMP